MTRRAACWRPLFKNCAKVRVCGRGRKIHRSSDFIVFAVLYTHTHTLSMNCSPHIVSQDAAICPGVTWFTNSNLIQKSFIRTATGAPAAAALSVCVRWRWR